MKIGRQLQISERSGVHADGGEMKLSVILPTYNHGHVLSKALDALLAQERLPDEIIVVDDASKDDTPAVIERYLALSDRIRTLRNEVNLGALGALQRGLNASRGVHVYFAAADDSVLPGFFSTGLDALARNPTVGLFCGDAVLRDCKSGRSIGRRPVVGPSSRVVALAPADVELLLTRADNFILTGSALFRRDLVLARGGFDPRAGSFADGLLCRKIALSNGFVYAPVPVAVWNVSQESYSRKTALDLAKARSALDTIPALIATDREFPAWYADTFQRRWRFAVARLAIEAGPDAGAAVLELGASSLADRLVLRSLISLLGLRPAKWLALAWLTLRLKPYRVRDVVLTALRRRTEGRRPGRAAVGRA